MNDRELLELAAKAAGIKALRDPQGCWRDCTGMYPAMNIYAANAWNPLTDDGDALRLAVKLGMETYHADDDGWFAYASHPTARGIAYAVEPHENDPYAATRRAIVRAAAEIGEHMEKQHGN